jgi:hypothetical protein
MCFCVPIENKVCVATQVLDVLNLYVTIEGSSAQDINLKCQEF